MAENEIPALRLFAGAYEDMHMDKKVKIKAPAKKTSGFFDRGGRQNRILRHSGKIQDSVNGELRYAALSTAALLHIRRLTGLQTAHHRQHIADCAAIPHDCGAACVPCL